MNLIDTFVETLDTEEDSKLDLKDILTKDEDIYLWEKFVDIFECIELDDIIDSLRKVSAKYKLARDEEITILAYVKFLELMVTRASMVRSLKDIEKETKDKKSPPNTRMYG
tara:strand:- start:684 stop:1016 length:333 start_codon:yes stop_codon:yes gene_type:complete